MQQQREEKTYTPREFGKRIGKTVKTLQRWDQRGIFKAHRTPSNRRFYTESQYLHYMSLSSTEEGDRGVKEKNERIE